MSACLCMRGSRAAVGLFSALFAAAMLATSPGAIAADPPSFSKEIVPVLVGKCGGCHVSGRKGDFQMASYEGLMRSGKLSPGAGNASRIVEVIVTGDMPRGGGKVSPADLALLVKWIDAGAVFDGTDPAAPLGGPARPVAKAPMPEVPQGTQPLRPGDVSFAFEVAPVIIQRCIKCHGDMNAEENLRMSTLEGMLRGGASGPAVMPGKSGESLLVKKIRGRNIDGQQMPLGGPPLSDDVIATIERWIDQGARIDLLGARQPLDAVAAAGRARSLSDADLASVRETAGLTLWRLAIPDEQAVSETRDRVRLVGNLPASRMEELADQAVELEGRVRKELMMGDEPLLKGGVTVYAFRNSYDYSAFWQHVMRAERPKGLTGRAGTSGDVVYGAMLLSGSDTDADSKQVLLAEQIAGAALAGRTLPDWFVRGGSRAVAARLLPKAALALAWKKDAAAAAHDVGSADDLFAGHAEPSTAALASGGFVSAIAASPGRLKQFVSLIDEGVAFDAAFTQVFRGNPRQMYEAWAAKQPRKTSRGR